MVRAASFQTLDTWDNSLPSPQTDVEHTVRRRIKARLFEMAGKECREKAPEIADKWNELMNKLESVGINAPGRM